MVSVLIVGAGPAGLTLAAKLHQCGVDVRIIDQHEAPTKTSNAAALHARTLELLTGLGVVDEMIAQGNLVHAFEMGSFGKKIAQFSFSSIHSRYPFLLDLPQNQTEAILIAHLKAQGVEVECNTRLLTLQQNTESVVAVLQTPHGEETVESRWLVGCDGFHSQVRAQLNIPYEGKDLPLSFIMIDAPVKGDLRSDRLYAYFTSTLSLALFPLPHSMRMIAEISGAKHYHSDQLPDESIFEAIAKECLPYEIHIEKPLWASRFLVHERLARRYQKDRVFLVGDAAHAHSPAGGQGMNTGMQDAINLAWKLASVIQNRASTQLLKSYEIERLPIAKNVIAKSEKMTLMAMTRSQILITLRDYLLPKISRSKWVMQLFVNTLAQMRIRYANKPWFVPSKKGMWVSGMAAPEIAFKEGGSLLSHLNGHHWLLLMADSSAVPLEKESPFSSWVLLRTSAEISKNTFYLVRPDGYIAYVGQEIKTVIQVLTLYSQ